MCKTVLAQVPVSLFFFYILRSAILYHSKIVYSLTCKECISTVLKPVSGNCVCL